MKEIIVNPDCVALVDEKIFDYINQIKWYTSNGYAISGGGKNNIGIKSRTKMHRLIWSVTNGVMPPSILIDHINGNKLDNRICNLRIANKNQNVHNQKKRKNTSNNYKGTQFIKKIGLWQSRCRIDKGDYFLGYFDNEIAAAYAYNKKASELSEYALINNLPFEKEYLEKLLITSRRKIKASPMRSKYNFIFYHHSQWPKYDIIINHEGRKYYRGGFKTEESAFNFLITEFGHLIKGKPLFRNLR